MTKKIIAVFDFAVTPESPAGSCVLQLLTHLSHDYQFVVFADRFTNPAPNSIRWVRIPLPDKPVIARYVFFKYLAPVYYQRFLRQIGRSPDLVISTEGEFADCDICYVHFCHRAYLQKQLLNAASLKGLVRLLMHRFNAKAEAEALTRASTAVVPSQGLANELIETYGDCLVPKVTTIPNPIDVRQFSKPKTFAAESHRAHLGLEQNDTVVVFTALGDFERKGLDLVLQAIAALNIADKASDSDSNSHHTIKLLVVGGNPSSINKYTTLCKQLQLINQVIFVGFQSDVRSYLWLSDAFILPSAYETFSLAAFQAAIANLPIICTQLYGVEDFLRSGENGWLIERTVESIVTVLKQINADPTVLSEMGERAHTDASSRSLENFITCWRSLLAQLLPDRSLPDHSNSVSSPVTTA